MGDLIRGVKSGARAPLQSPGLALVPVSAPGVGAPAAISSVASAALAGGTRSAVLSHAPRQRRCGGDPSVLKKSIQLNGEAYAATATLIAAAAPLACLVPARRAAKIVPMEALGYE